MGFWGFLKTKVAPALDKATESPLKDIVPIVGKIDAAKDMVKGVVDEIPASVEAWGKELSQWPEERINEWLVRLGHAFGPPGIIHFSELSEVAQRGLLERVPILKTTHTDWIDPFKWVPRRTVCWIGGTPYTKRHVLEGAVSHASILDNGELRPIPAIGDWYVVDGYMAATTADGWHDRLGWRWDDVDRYWDLSLALKRAN